MRIFQFQDIPQTNSPKKFNPYCEPSSNHIFSLSAGLKQEAARQLPKTPNEKRPINCHQ